MEFRFWLAQSFNLIARWFPRNLRKEFGDELEEVLSERMLDAADRGWLPLLGLALHELLQLPGLHAREKASKLLGGGITMSNPSIFDDLKEPTPWGWALLGLIPFLFGPIGWVFQRVFLLVTGLGGLPTGPFAIQVIGYAYLLLILSICAVLVTAWVKGFPAWSYGLGMIFLLVSLYMTSVAMPGLTLFGYVFRSNQLMGLLAWIPLGIVVLAAFVLTREDIARPFQMGIRALRDDFTRVSFGLFAFTPFIMWIFFDEVHGEEPFLLLSSLLLGGCALAYLRARRVAIGVGAMLAGMLLAYSATGLYLWWWWEGRVVEYLPEPIDGFSNMIGTLTCALPLIVLTLGPWLIYRVTRRRREV